MNTDVGELLREGLNQLTADVQVPADLADRARRGHRRRQLAVRAWLAAGTALVTAAVMALAVGWTGELGGSGHPAGGSDRHDTGPGQQVRYETAAYTVRHIERALAGANGQIMVVTAYGNSSSQGGTAPVLRSWTYHGTTKSEKSWTGISTASLFRDDGSPSTLLFVNYTQKTWFRQAWKSAPLTYAKNVCVGPADDEPGYNSASWAQFVSSSLACGGLTVTKRVDLGGVAAIEIVGTPKDVDAKYVPQTIFVNATTYLPIRILYPFGYDEINWLPPTPANRALLKLTVPAGFRRIPAPKLAA